MKSVFEIWCLITVFVLHIGIIGCHKKQEADYHATAKAIYESNKNSWIEFCTYKKQKVFCVQANAYDAGGVIYDCDKKQLGICSYAWQQVDEICHQLADCETIYIVEDNIWGEPAVDKWELAK
ncbi:MAG: hypothetical protein JNM36_19325 [Chitinophagales bacterium]|nr:hypothetical protein [Chitinophagales bacterium]HNI43700.1 hypothetical protein [Chitinophagales bacterium]HNL06016.1 hypothetical protein [Chitinophagales bacterium]